MKNGFTLIEMLVVVGIMGVLAAVGVASYNRIGDQAKAQQVAQLMVTSLRSAQKDADSGKGAQNCGGSSLYGVKAIYTQPEMVISWVCTAGATGVLSRVNLNVQNGTTVTWTPSDRPVIFRSLSRGVTDALPTAISVSVPGKTYNITVTPNGGVSAK